MSTRQRSPGDFDSPATEGPCECVSCKLYRSGLV